MIVKIADADGGLRRLRETILSGRLVVTGPGGLGLGGELDTVVGLDQLVVLHARQVVPLAVAIADHLGILNEGGLCRCGGSPCRSLHRWIRSGIPCRGSRHTPDRCGRVGQPFRRGGISAQGDHDRRNDAKDHQHQEDGLDIVTGGRSEEGLADPSRLLLLRDPLPVAITAAIESLVHDSEQAIAEGRRSNNLRSPRCALGASSMMGHGNRS